MLESAIDLGICQLLAWQSWILPTSFWHKYALQFKGRVDSNI